MDLRKKNKQLYNNFTKCDCQNSKILNKTCFIDCSHNKQEFILFHCLLLSIKAVQTNTV